MNDNINIENFEKETNLKVKQITKYKYVEISCKSYSYIKKAINKYNANNNVNIRYYNDYYDCFEDCTNINICYYDDCFKYRTYIIF